MQIQKNLTLALAGTLMLTSCGKLGELTADNFTVTPSPMEMVGGQVPVTINGRFPEKYMKLSSQSPPCFATKGAKLSDREPPSRAKK